MTDTKISDVSAVRYFLVLGVMIFLAIAAYAMAKKAYDKSLEDNTTNRRL